MKTAKQRFLETEYAKPFFDAVASPMLQTALEYAMLEMLQTETIGPDMNKAMSAGFRVDGARRFIEILNNLPVVHESKPKSVIPHNLPEL